MNKKAAMLIKGIVAGQSGNKKLAQKIIKDSGVGLPAQRRGGHRGAFICPAGSTWSDKYGFCVWDVQ